MAAIPQCPLTRGQILTQALRKAGNTKDTFRTLVTEAFGSILFDLYTQWDWPFLHITVGLPLAGAIFLLPADFYRTTDDASLTIIRKDGAVVRQPILEVDEATITLQSPAEGTPRLWALRRGDGIGILWPAASGDCIASLRYMAVPIPLVDDDQFPTFPWATYLVQEVFCWVLDYEGDPRSTTEQQKKELMLDRIRKVALPNHSQAPDIPLDPLLFGHVFDGD